jgi:hypothetical protein
LALAGKIKFTDHFVAQCQLHGSARQLDQEDF